MARSFVVLISSTTTTSLEVSMPMNDFTVHGLMETGKLMEKKIDTRMACVALIWRKGRVLPSHCAFLSVTTNERRNRKIPPKERERERTEALVMHIPCACVCFFPRFYPPVVRLLSTSCGLLDFLIGLVTHWGISHSTVEMYCVIDTLGLVENNNTKHRQ